MSVVAVGIEHGQASLELLERVAIPEERLGKALATLSDRTELSEVVVLSTCLRTEVYAVAELFHQGVEQLQRWLAELAGTTVEDLHDTFTVLFDDLVTVHLFEVASGLRSAVPGETEVLGQVRRALEQAQNEQTAGPVLTSLFRRAVQAGRRARESTAVHRGTTSIAHAAVELAASWLGGSLDGRSIVVVGAGEMGEGMVNALARLHQDIRLTVVNRTVSKACKLASRAGGKGVGLAGLENALTGAHAVLLSTGSGSPVLSSELLGRVVAARRKAAGGTAGEPEDAGAAPLVVVDLGVPRNVEPAVGELPGVELLDIDDLRRRTEQALEQRRAELDSAREVVRSEYEKYRAEVRSRGATPLVAALRSRLEELRRIEVGKISLSDSPESEAVRAQVEAATRALLAKILHTPTVVLKESAGTPRGERLAEAVRSLFDV
jgi:glutamyl-tRNA reductase